MSAGKNRNVPVFALASATLLIVSFPNFNQPGCAWVALVPWLLLLRRVSARGAFWWSWGIGALFFLGSIWWLLHVTLVGWLLLCAILALYFGLFGLLANRCMVHGSWFMVVVLPAAWVALEYARSHLLSGFGWNLLAYSQTPWTALIQLAELTGAWGVSSLIVLVNVALADLLTQRGRPSLCQVALAAVAVAAALGYGAWRLDHLPAGVAVRVAVVQGNIPQEEKWDEAYAEAILARYERLTREAARDGPQLIVWPETAVPGYLGLEEPMTQRMTALAREAGIPLLVGAPMGRLRGTAWELTNSAALVDADGMIRQRYDKLHLVPFGEMIPFERALFWVRSVLPPIGEFVPGHDATVFDLGSRLKAQGSPARLPGPYLATAGAGSPEPGRARLEGGTPFPSASSLELRFSVLICFEDLFPALARRFVREGAGWLLVITNDAWFGPTAAAFQHAQASTFRAVELRRPVARAANTGWSGCIDAAGRWVGRVHDARGTELFVPGTCTCELPAGAGQTLFLRWGDWFALLCGLGTLGWLVSRAILRSRPSS